MSAPLVSVVIPVYNRDIMIKRAIDSVLAQTWKDFEIIVVDDGSTDHTAKVIRSYSGQVRYYYQKHAGVAVARNMAIEHARGIYVAFLDSDDEWLPDKLQMQIQYCLAHPEYALIFTDMAEAVDGRNVSEKYLHDGGYGRISSSDIYEGMIENNFIFTPTVIARRDALNKVGLFDPNLGICEDRDLWLRIAQTYPVGFLDLPLTVRHRHDGNLTKDSSLYLLSHIALFTKHYELARLANHPAAGLLCRKLADSHENAGCFFLRGGKHSTARCNFIKSLRYELTLRRMTLACVSLFPICCIELLRAFKKRLL